MASNDDIFGQVVGSDNNANNGQTDSNSYRYVSTQELEYLRSIDNTVKQILRNGQTISQSDARYAMPKRYEFRNDGGSKWAPPSRRKNAKTEFVDSLSETLIDSVVGSDFKYKVRGALSVFAESLGTELEDLPATLGKQLGNSLIKAFKDSDIGKSTISGFNNIKNQAINAFKAGVANYDAQNGSNYLGAMQDMFARAKSAAAAMKAEDSRPADNTSPFGFRQSNMPSSMDLSVDNLAVHTNIVYLYSDSIRSETGFGESSYSTTKDTSFSRSRDIIDVDYRDIDVPPSGLSDQVGDFAQDYISDKLGDIASDKVGDFAKDRISSLGKSNLGKLAKNAPASIKGLLPSGSAAGTAATGNAVASGAAAGTTATAGSSALTATAGSSLATTSASGVAATGGAAAAGGSMGGAMMAGLTNVVGALGMTVPQLALAVGAAIIAFKLAQVFVNKLKAAVAPAIEGTKDLVEAAKESANRYHESRSKNLDLANKRLRDDVMSIIEEPFTILKSAAERVYDVWDGSLRVINGTQGYNKSDLQHLMSGYAERLRSDGLTKVVSNADITENLSKVLESGLSGKVAEEFAYRATILNAAVPTQDFFGYGETYASIAANAIARGSSETEAIKYANQQLELFASNVLYASRQISGGFSTGLKDAQSIFEQSVKIAQASKRGDPSQIAGVMTAVASATGAVAPDLANALTDAVYQAATGGNSSDLVALRSLAGVNASNSEFLRQVAENPQKVFANLFTNLANMQNMSESAHMEVAEGLASIFGLPMEALARVDFNYLAQAINSMNVNNKSLNDNLELLASGETTLTSEQLKIQQINEYMLKEGLAYVLDNEVARSIQEHMWEEQLAREMMEAEYGVNLQGKALGFLEGLAQTVDNILNLLNPFGWMKKVAELVGTAMEASAQEADIRQILELGKVGNGDIQTLYKLTTRNKDLNLSPSVVNLMGGFSAYEAASSFRKVSSSLVTGDLLNPNHSQFIGNQIDMRSMTKSALSTIMTSSISDAIGPTSSYRWNTIGKSSLSLLDIGKSVVGNLLPSFTMSAGVSSITQMAQNQISGRIQSMLEDSYIGKFIEEGKNYEDWANSAKNFGIADFASAIQEAGYTETQLQGYFQSKETAAGAAEEHERRVDEKDFRDKGRQYFIDEKELTSQLVDLVTETNTKLQSIIDNQLKFHEYWLDYRSDWDIYHGSSTDHYDRSEIYYDNWDMYYKDWTDMCKEWTDYFINHVAYRKAYNHTDVTKISRSEKDESYTAIYTLAKSLTKNTVDLLDPTVQTNALLSQILIVVNAIAQQNNQTEGGLTLADTVAGMALGFIKEG